MNFHELLEAADEEFFQKVGRRLSEVEISILEGSWKRQSYEEIALATNYSVGYLKRHVGPRLWKLFANVVGEEVSKNTFYSSLERWWRSFLNRENQAVKPQHQADSRTPGIISLTNRIDWGEAVDISKFCGRIQELSILEQWIVTDSCRLVAVLGLCGIGKTTLAVKVATQVQSEFKYVIWKSLQNSPPLEMLLANLVSFISDLEETKAEIGRLLHYLRASRCLIILDHIETILDADHAGEFRSGYEGYGELLKVIGETAHQSCLIVTSREKPAEIAVSEGVQLAVRSLRLSGSREAALALFEAKGLVGETTQKQELCDRYGNNPLMIKIVATSIRDLFDSEIRKFLQQGTFVFNGIRHLLDQQFQRLSPLEQNIMYWLAIDREGASIAELELYIMSVGESRENLLEALEWLWRRSLLEKHGDRYTQESIVKEYIKERSMRAGGNAPWC